MIVSCGRHDCTWELDVLTQPEADRRLTVHLQQRHGIAPMQGVQQLPGVSWQATFLEAVRALPVGWQGTTADLHALVPPPPHHNSWGTGTAAASHMGLLREVGRQESDLATTKRSLVRRWERVVSGVKSA